ncbi:MAG: TonB-dependent receptor [Verrucomicrobia bacterium]|nr:TonB-dependent receptor [Verrucomicrobiota bacterium]
MKLNPASILTVTWIALGALATARAGAQTEAAPVQLETYTVFSNRVALQEPVSTFAAPISALVYEPQVDVQARSFAEGQADVSIRGGTFENTGFTVGALPIYDPQTGHYSAELPISSYMLGAPEVRVGGEHAATGFNSTAGGVVYAWRPIHTGGAVSVGMGGDDLARGEIYTGFLAKEKIGGFSVGADASVASARGDGTRKWKDTNGVARDSGFDFQRVSGRVQVANAVSQTDIAAGYQDKDFGWPNLYAARPTTALRYEREELQTKLFVVNNRTELGADGDFVQGGAYYRGHRDHYSIPLLGANSYHQTLVRGAAFDGRQTIVPGTAVKYASGLISDDLDSNSLNKGHFMSRTQVYGSLAAEQTVALSDTRDLVMSAGTRYDDSNRDSSELSPIASVELRQEKAGLRRLYLSYDESTQLPSYTALNSAAGGLFGGNPNLPRATSQNLELGAELAAAAWTVQSAVFYRQDDNLNDYIFDPTGALGTSRTAAAVGLDTLGFEAFVRYSQARFDLLAGYTYLHKADNYQAPRNGSFYALNYAEHRLTVGGVGRLGAGFELRVDNEFRRQADNALRREGADNVLSAAGLFYQVPGVKGLTLNAQVENVWDTAFQEVPLVPSSGLTWSTGATYVW